MNSAEPLEGSSGVPLVDRPKPPKSAPAKAKPPGLSLPGSVFAARLLFDLAIGTLIVAGAVMFFDKLTLADRITIGCSAIASATILYGLSVLVQHVSDSAHWAKHTAELLHRAEVKSDEPRA